MLKVVLTLVLAGVTLTAVQLTLNDTQQEHKLAGCEALPAEHPAPLPSDARAQKCDPVSNQPSWSNWLSGQSRSTQFHYLDLVELLFGEQAEQHTQRNSSSRY